MTAPTHAGPLARERDATPVRQRAIPVKRPSPRARAAALLSRSASPDLAVLRDAVADGRDVSSLWQRLSAATRDDTTALTHVEIAVALHGAMRVRRHSVRTVAHRFGVSHQHLTLVLSGHRVASRRLRACIAVYAGLHIKAVPRTFAPLYLPPEIRHPRRRRRSTHSDDET